MRQCVALGAGRVALLLVDFQEEQRQGPDHAVESFDEILGNVRLLLETARSRHMPVFHAAYRRDFDLCPPRPFEPLTPDGAPAFSDKAGPLTVICREVEPLADEPVIHKNDASAFCEGTLAPQLDGAGIEWLIVTGVWTEACIAASVRDAMAHGFRVLLVKDACGSGTRAMHQTAVLNLANRLYGGAVGDTVRTVQFMRGEPVELWVAERPVPILFRYDDAEEHYARL